MRSVAIQHKNPGETTRFARLSAVGEESLILHRAHAHRFHISPKPSQLSCKSARDVNSGTAPPRRAAAARKRFFSLAGQCLAHFVAFSADSRANDSGDTGRSFSTEPLNSSGCDPAEETGPAHVDDGADALPHHEQGHTVGHHDSAALAGADDHAISLLDRSSGIDDPGAVDLAQPGQRAGLLFEQAPPSPHILRIVPDVVGEVPRVLPLAGRAGRETCERTREADAEDAQSSEKRKEGMSRSGRALSSRPYCC